MNNKRRLTVENTDGLYYTIRFQEQVEGNWVTNHNLTNFVHENRLEDTIATMLRGPSCLASQKTPQKG